MAELNTGGGDKDKKVRSKKQNAGVDLTAMVDLAFLLITFFMLTTSMNKPQSMNLAMPDKSEDIPKEEKIKVDENRTMTVLIGGDNKMKWYMGMPGTPLEGPTESSYGKEGIRKVLLEKDKQAKAYSQDVEKGLIVIIKASDKANYSNLIDILDEMAITNIGTYAIVDITPEEVEMLGEN
ncbi:MULTISPECIES: ExbD/TolR family protein [Myroides]|uniref:Biopolymer transporter ExbD n=1 Tax=Myroides albus TaxID=2562892 RepID=A0A6I3LKK0_9FLAO|nr:MULTISPECIES: biopolymer transporter ExbD [Myroides]MTG97041.1 biopolymer transporter ExbD [Myroides albus]MVX36000.1 biopolymer transporter ExbD [Myroides sp. LoEW2-1]UVD78535.1 biopolymer transporter ExbD [Myroides albus]